jgi:ClpP class serine protease
MTCALPIQSEVEDLRMKFASAVASGRGMKVDAVLATEAACMNADAAVKSGFADGVASSFAIVQMFLDDIAGASSAPSSAAPGALAAAAPQKTSLESSMEVKTGAAAPVDTAAAKAEGATEAKARIKAITGHAEAEGRAELAQHLAFDTDMSVEQPRLRSSRPRPKRRRPTRARVSAPPWPTCASLASKPTATRPRP